MANGSLLEEPAADERQVDGGSAGDDGGAGATGLRPGWWRRRWMKPIWGLIACVCAGALVVGGVGVFAQHRLLDHVHRVSGVFSGLPHRPARASGAAAGAENILLLGSDSRSKAPTTGDDASNDWKFGAQRSDTMMVVHVSADRRQVTAISIPRDSWVDVPGYGDQKINAAFSYGGPRLAVQTVERLTGLRMDHIAIIDWDGFRSLTNALGGVDVTIPKTVYDSARKKTWTAGEHHLNGKEALLYVRQRHGLPGGDFDRVKRQQNLIRALSRKLLSGGTLTNPVKLYHALSAVTRNVTVDSGWSNGDLRSFALSLRHLRGSGMHFTTAPIAGTGREGAQDVVYLDKTAGNGLWRAVRQDKVGRWFTANPDANLGSTVR